MTSLPPQASPKPLPPKPKSVFVVSPIGVPGSDPHQKASYALKYIFREALKGDEWEVHRADEGKSPDSIGQHVIKRLYEADLVIADLTGHNPNVFYELAIAHGWRKPVVHLIAKGEKVPFDIVDQRTIFYDITDLASVEEAVDRLREYATYALEHAKELVTPLTSFEMFSQIRADNTDGGAAVAEVLEQVVSRLARMESKMTGLGLDSRLSRKEVPAPYRDSRNAEVLLVRYLSLMRSADSLKRGPNRSKQDSIEVHKLKNEMDSLMTIAQASMTTMQFESFLDAAMGQANAEA